MDKKIEYQEEFIKKSIRKYGENAFDYSLVKYVDYRTKVRIICNVHGILLQSVRMHFMNGCFRCNKNYSQKQKQQFIENATKKYGDRFDYSEVNYVDYRKKIKIICIIHGYIYQTISEHLHYGCKQCNNNKINEPAKISFIQAAIKKYGDKYNYELVNSVSKETVFLCMEHAIAFEQKFIDFLTSPCCLGCKNEMINEFQLKITEI